MSELHKELNIPEALDVLPTPPKDLNEFVKYLQQIWHLSEKEAGKKLVEILRVSKEGYLKEQKKILSKENFESLEYHLDHLSQAEIIDWLFWPIAEAQEDIRTENIDKDESLVRDIVNSVAAKNLLNFKPVSISEDSPVDPILEATILKDLEEDVDRLLDRVGNNPDKDKLPN